jgi:hypothetical protein
MISDVEYEQCPVEQRAWAYYGKGHIILVVGDFYGCRLTVIAPSKIHQPANLAYVVNEAAETDVENSKMQTGKIPLRI